MSKPLQNDMNESAESISDLLVTVQNKYRDSERVSVDQLVNDLKERGFGILFIIFCAIPALPIPAQGIATILALPVMLLALQLIIGKDEIWLPQFIRKKSVGSGKVIKVTRMALPLMKRFEYLSRPRLLFMTRPLMERIIGVFVLLSSISMAMPIPFSNTIPSIGIVIMSLGMIEKDGLAIMGGMMIGITGVVITTTIIFLGTEALTAFIDFIQAQFGA
ncbi:MAG: exopolysaccharide biosynthesis protein [Rickettsiales bacterium]|nr:exopolysaccharide biosynthesis protein [Rickettsiales bacterium]